MTERSPIYEQFPDVKINVTPYAERYVVRIGEATLVDTRKGLLLLETDHAPVVYVPEGEVDMSFLSPTDHKSVCPFKGMSSYWTIRVGDLVHENAVWSYPEPLPEVAAIKNHLAFYPHLVDASPIVMSGSGAVKKPGIAFVGLLIGVLLFHFWVLEASGVAVAETRKANGETRSTHVWFVEQNGQIWVEAGTPTNGWYRDVLLEPAITLSIDGRASPFTAVPIQNPDARDKLRALLRKKYGFRDWWIGIVIDTTESIPVRLDAAVQ